MKVFPRPPTWLTYALVALLGVVLAIWLDRFLGGAIFGYVSLGLPLLLWVWDKSSSRPTEPRTANRPDPAELIASYVRYQVSAAQTLPVDQIFGDGLRPQGCSQVHLRDVYVPLDVAEADDPAQVNDPQMRRLSFRREMDRAVPLTQALARGIDGSRTGLRAVLLGEAGGGKSSAVGDLIQRCAAPELDATGAPDWPSALRDRSVLRLDLRRLELQDADLASPSSKPFWRAVSRDLCNRVDGLDPEQDQTTAPVTAAVAAIRAGLMRRGLLLLDGLDEVLDPERRRGARDGIERLASELGPGCAVLVTARPYVYPDHALRDFAIWQLQPLSPAESDGGPSQVRRLVDNWHRALGAEEAAGARLSASLAADRGRSEMATRPLLLTLLIALGMQRRRDGRGEPLPADRSALIDEATALFVNRWFARIRRDGRDLPDDLLDALDEQRLRGVLQAISLQAQHLRRDDGGLKDDADDLQIEVYQSSFRGALLDALPERLQGSARAADRLILERAGLLFPRGPGLGGETYGYVHRLFQEYLAACELVEQHHRGLSTVLSAALADNPGAWREVTRFTAARLARTHSPAEALTLVRALLSGADRAVLGERDYQAAVTAALALEDLLPLLPGPGGSRGDLDPDRQDAERRLDAWLLRLVDDPAPGPGTRRDLGRVCGRLGDPRPGVVPAGWTVDPARPFDLDADRDFDWIEIPAGRFRPGSDPGEPDADDDEHGGEPVHLAAFRIARYPVTQAQFAAFTRGGGYGGGEGRPPPWWRFSDEAEDWWQGGNPGAERSLAQSGRGDEDKEGYRRWLAARPKGARRVPCFQDDLRRADWTLPNHPVIGVSWFEAMAYCGWLTGRLRGLGSLGAGEVIRLPSEIEWECAARGPGRRRWPWGDHWRQGAANTAEAGLASTTAVGLFPQGATGDARDLAGNVWEWTATRWGGRLGSPDYGWPLADDDRDDPRGDHYRVTRGGSWYGSLVVCRGSFRDRVPPHLWDGALGFRVIRVFPDDSDS